MWQWKILAKLTIFLQLMGISLVFSADCDNLGPYLEARLLSPNGALVDSDQNQIINMIDLIAWHNRCLASCAGLEIPPFPADTSSAEFNRFQTWVDQSGSTINPGYDTTSSMTFSHNAGTTTLNANLSPAFIHTSQVTQWHRDLTFTESLVTVHDTFTVSAGVSAFWQLNVPEQPVINGGSIQAGNLTITPIIPASPSITLTDWTTVDPDHLSGWKITLAGGSEYVVQIAITP